MLALHIGANIKTEGRSARAIVDPYGNGVIGAPGVKGGHESYMHEGSQRFVVMAAKKAGVSVKGSSQVDTCHGILGSCLNLGENPLSEGAQVTLQKLIPDFLIIGRAFCDLGPFTLMILLIA